jgi:hypothetical protein
VDQALVAVAGIVIGALLGGSGKYFTSRRDAWAEARASGLLLLADVRALLETHRTELVDAGASLGVKSWESHQATLAHFRRGSFPNGFKAPEWLALAACFARLKKFQAEPKADRGEEWSKSVGEELLAAERLLAPFEEDPPVLSYVVSTGVMSRIEILGRAGMRLDAAIGARAKRIGQGR